MRSLNEPPVPSATMARRPWMPLLMRCSSEAAPTAFWTLCYVGNAGRIMFFECMPSTNYRYKIINSKPKIRWPARVLYTCQIHGSTCYPLLTTHSLRCLSMSMTSFSDSVTQRPKYLKFDSVLKGLPPRVTGSTGTPVLNTYISFLKKISKVLTASYHRHY